MKSGRHQPKDLAFRMEVSTMEKLPKQVYTSEFRQQAVAMITRDKLSVAEASRKLSISQKTLAN
jgi:transposase-like protein